MNILHLRRYVSDDVRQITDFCGEQGQYEVRYGTYSLDHFLKPQMEDTEPCFDCANALAQEIRAFMDANG